MKWFLLCLWAVLSSASTAAPPLWLSTIDKTQVISPNDFSDRNRDEDAKECNQVAADVSFVRSNIHQPLAVQQSRYRVYIMKRLGQDELTADQKKKVNSEFTKRHTLASAFYADAGVLDSLSGTSEIKDKTFRMCIAVKDVIGQKPWL